ncbi:MAG: hypothetical protein JWM16_3474 [Verrucomicrobiales bacterium]|nr:hypothetical protein [Verrucomicrobiales bacterium]
MSESNKSIWNRVLAILMCSGVLATIVYYAAIDQWENGPAREQQRDQRAAAQKYAELCANDTVEEAAALGRLTKANIILRETGIDTRNLQELAEINDTFKRAQKEGPEYFRKYKNFLTLAQLQKWEHDRTPDNHERFKAVYWNGFNDGYVTEESRSVYNRIRPERFKD